MKVVVRTDCSLQIGTGHVMRTLSLADELLSAGTEVEFVCAELPGHLLELIRQRGFKASGVRAGLSPQADAAATLGIIGPAGCDWLIVDHYGISSDWESSMRPGARRILVIDDLADRPHDCDVIFDQSFTHDSSDRYAKLVPKGARKMYGPSFALLRKEFADARSRGAMSLDVKRGLISFGGTDPTHETMKVLGAVSAISGVSWLVVAGAGNPDLPAIQKKCTSSGLELHVQPRNMAELMAQCGFALGAGGTTVWERAALGLPTLTILTADNQRYQAAELSAGGYIRLLGESAQVDAGMISAAVSQALGEWPALRKMGAASAALTDAAGAQRVAQELVKLS